MRRVGDKPTATDKEGRLKRAALPLSRMYVASVQREILPKNHLHA